MNDRPTIANFAGWVDEQLRQLRAAAPEEQALPEWAADVEWLEQLRAGQADAEDAGDDAALAMHLDHRLIPADRERFPECFATP